MRKNRKVAIVHLGRAANSGDLEDVKEIMQKQ
jgi:hypothetical protein